MQQFAKAEEHFDQAIGIEPKNPVHRVYKGWACFVVFFFFFLLCPTWSASSHLNLWEAIEDVRDVRRTKGANERSFVFVHQHLSSSKSVNLKGVVELVLVFQMPGLAGAVLSHGNRPYTRHWAPFQAWKGRQHLHPFKNSIPLRSSARY